MLNPHTSQFYDQVSFERYIGRFAVNAFFQSGQSHHLAADIRDLTGLLAAANSIALDRKDQEEGLAVVLQRMNCFLRDLTTGPATSKRKKLGEITLDLLDALEKIHTMCYDRRPKDLTGHLEAIGQTALAAIQRTNS